MFAQTLTGVKSKKGQVADLLFQRGFSDNTTVRLPDEGFQTEGGTFWSGRFIHSVFPFLLLIKDDQIYTDSLQGDGRRSHSRRYYNGFDIHCATEPQMICSLDLAKIWAGNPACRISIQLFIDGD